jgi:hypothetical protein
MQPNQQFELPRYGRRRKPGPRWSSHRRGPGLRRVPPRSVQLQRLVLECHYRNF